MFEEAIRGATRDDGSSPGEDAEISGGVECEGEQVEGDKDTGKGFLAVAKVVLEMVSVGHEHVEVSFSIFHLARPQAASSATVSDVIAPAESATGRGVEIK